MNNIKYGLNFTATDAKNYITQNTRDNNGVKVWENLFGNATMSAMRQSDILKSDYTNTIAEAYKANIANKDAIAKAGLTNSATQRMLQENNIDLNDVYQQYLQNYQTGMNTIAENYQKTVTAYDEALNTEAQNYVNTYNSAYDYIKDELQYSDYRGINHELDWLFVNDNDLNSENSKYTEEQKGQLKTWDQIVREGELFDDEGRLTIKGTEFFDYIFNAQPQMSQFNSDKESRLTRGYDEWLSNKNPELRDWLNAGGFSEVKKSIGLKGDDDSYHRKEYANATEGDERFKSVALGDDKNVNANIETNETKFREAFGYEADDLFNEAMAEFEEDKKVADAKYAEYEEYVKEHLDEWYTSDVRSTIEGALNYPNNSRIPNLKIRDTAKKYKKYYEYKAGAYGYGAKYVLKDPAGLYQQLVKDGSIDDTIGVYGEIYADAYKNYDENISKIFTDARKKSDKK